MTVDPGLLVRRPLDYVLLPAFILGIINAVALSLPEALGVPRTPDSPWPVLRALHTWAVEQEPQHLVMPPTLQASLLYDAFVQLPLLVVLVRASADPPAAVPLTWATAGACFSVTHLLAVGPLVVAGVALQRSFLTNAAWRGALVGAICGLGAAIGIHAHCPVETVSHILVAHGLAIVSGGGLGALLGALRGRA